MVNREPFGRNKGANVVEGKIAKLNAQDPRHSLTNPSVAPRRTLQGKFS